MLNKVILTGRLTAAPELKTTTGGISVTGFTLAVARNYKNTDGQYDTDFVPLVAWGKTAEFAASFLERGQMISVVGELQSRKYEDRDGKSRTAYEVNAREILFASPKSEGAHQAEQAPALEELSADLQSAEDELPF